MNLRLVMFVSANCKKECSAKAKRAIEKLIEEGLIKTEEDQYKLTVCKGELVCLAFEVIELLAAERNRLFK